MVRTIVKGKNLDVHEDDRAYAEGKMRRVERLLDDRSEAIVEFSRERHRSTEDQHIVEVTLVIDGRTLRSVADGASFRAAVDEVVDKLERRAVDHKERPRERGRVGDRRDEGLRSEVRTAEADSVGGPAPAPAPRVVKVKRFALEPMFEEDAVARMEELGHAFFVFLDAETERWAVLYRRHDGDYGLIEPTSGGSYAAGQRQPSDVVSNDGQRSSGRRR